MTDPFPAPRHPLGTEAARRWRRPGPAVRSPRSALLGLLASGATRFAAGTGRPVAVRRMLAGPDELRVQRLSGATVRPPRWWHPSPEPVTPALPERGLRRAAAPVPDERTWRPGSFSAATAPKAVPMRLPAEVQAAGRMITSLDTRRRSAPPRRAPDPGNPTGTGPTSQAPGAATGAPDPATATSPATRPTGATL
ncbi:hypothetical protein FHE66_12190, partial [Georgenia sp. 311]